MRFRHATRPNRQRIRNVSQPVLDPVEAEVFRDGLPGEESFPSGVSVGDPTTPPAQVQGVTATAGLRTTLIEWDRLDGFQTVDGAGGYEVQLDTVNTFDAAPRVQRTSATMASFTDLAPDTTYYVRVRGVQGESNAGAWSATASTTTALADTGDIQASAVTADKIAANAVTASKLAAITMDVGKFIQSSNYDGTDVAANDATQGFRIEAEGDAEFQNVRVRGDMRANTLVSTSGDDNLIPNWSFEDPLTGDWTVDVGTLDRFSYISTSMGSYVLRYQHSEATAQRPTLTYDRVTGIVPGASYYVAIMAARPQGDTEEYFLDLHVDWYDDTDTLISTSSHTEEFVAGHDFYTPVGGSDSPMMAPDNVAYAKVRIVFTSANGGDAVPNTSEVYFDGFYFAPFTFLKGVYVEDAANFVLQRSYDDRSPVSRFRPGYWWPEVPKTFDSDFNGQPLLFGDVANYGGGKRESQVGLATAEPALVGGGTGKRAKLYLHSPYQDLTAGARIAMHGDEVHFNTKKAWPAPRAYGDNTSLTVNSGSAIPFTGLTGSNPDDIRSGGWAFTAPTDGFYGFWVWANTGSNMAASRFLVGVAANGASSTIWLNDAGTNTTSPTYASGFYPAWMNEGDYIEGRVYQDSGGAVTAHVRARFWLMAPG